MDFPIVLERGRFVHGTEEMEQIIRILLQNEVMSFCQAYNVGSYYSLHDAVGEGIPDVKRTLEEINGVHVINVKNNGNTFEISLTYNGEDVTIRTEI